MRVIKFQNIFLTLLSVASILFFICYFLTSDKTHQFNKEQKKLLFGMQLDLTLRGSPEVITNSLEATLGRHLFEDVNLSKNKNVSCQTCHNPEKEFHDSENNTFRITGKIVKAPSIRGVHTQNWYFWNGRADSLWAQTLESFFTEHEVSESELINLVCSTYQGSYPEQTEFCSSSAINELKLKQIGELVESYVSTIDYPWTKFDEFAYQYSKKESFSYGDFLTYDEIQGLRLFLDREKTGCIDCHSGKAFSNGGFFSIGTGSPIDNGRISGVKTYLSSKFKCSDWSDDDKCLFSKYVRSDGKDLVGAFKVPSLRNLSSATSFMHDRRFKSVEEVITHYTMPSGYMYEYMDVKPLRLTPSERKHLVAFLKALNTPVFK